MRKGIHSNTVMGIKQATELPGILGCMITITYSFQGVSDPIDCGIQGWPSFYSVGYNAGWYHAQGGLEYVAIRAVFLWQ